MVWLKDAQGKRAYVCAECGLGYPDAATAISCEEHCSKHKGCDPDIAEKAIGVYP